MAGEKLIVPKTKLDIAGFDFDLDLDIRRKMSQNQLPHIFSDDTPTGSGVQYGMTWPFQGRHLKSLDMRQICCIAKCGWCWCLWMHLIPGHRCKRWKYLIILRRAFFQLYQSITQILLYVIMFEGLNNECFWKAHWWMRNKLIGVMRIGLNDVMKTIPKLATRNCGCRLWIRLHFVLVILDLVGNCDSENLSHICRCCRCRRICRWIWAFGLPVANLSASSTPRSGYSGKKLITVLLAFALATTFLESTLALDGPKTPTLLLLKKFGSGLHVGHHRIVHLWDVLQEVLELLLEVGHCQCIRIFLRDQRIQKFTVELRLVIINWCEIGTIGHGRFREMSWGHISIGGFGEVHIIHTVLDLSFSTLKLVEELATQKSYKGLDHRLVLQLTFMFQKDPLLVLGRQRGLAQKNVSLNFF